MVAVTTDIENRRRPAVRARHLTPVPARPLPVLVAPPAPANYRLRRAVAAIVVFGLAVAAWAALGVLGGALATPVGSASDPAAATVVVAPGDTFWSIASRIQPTGDVRPLVDRLVAAHGGATLRAGERILVPPS